MGIWDQARDAYKREAAYQKKNGELQEGYKQFDKERGGEDDQEFWDYNAKVAAHQDGAPRLWRKDKKKN